MLINGHEKCKPSILRINREPTPQRPKKFASQWQVTDALEVVFVTLERRPSPCSISPSKLHFERQIFPRNNNRIVKGLVFGETISHVSGYNESNMCRHVADFIFAAKMTTLQRVEAKYNAYRASKGFRAWDNSPLKELADLDEKVQNAWAAASAGTSGQESYALYAKAMDYKTSTGKDMPLWDHQNTDIKKAWECFASAS